MLRAILFDFNGVIIDDEPVHMRLFQALLAEEGVSLSEHDYYDRYLGYDDRGCFREALRDHGRSASDALLSALIARKAAAYDATIRNEMSLFPGAQDLITAASERHLLAVVSGALRREIELVLKTTGLLDRFRVIVSAEDVREGKPSSEGYQKALEALRAAPGVSSLRAEECLAIEDSGAGIASAHGAGIRCLGVAHSYPVSALQDADWTAPSLVQVHLIDLERSFEV